MTLQRRLLAVAAVTAGQVVALHRRHEAGELAAASLAAAAAATVAAANRRAVTIADLLVASMLAKGGRQVVPLGLTVPESDRDRLVDAVRSVLAAEIESVSTREELAASRAARLGRLARAEPLAAGQDGVQRAMTGQGVRRWVRQTDPSPCELCRRWDDGVARPVTARMLTHVGCGCVQRPVT